MRSPLCPRLLLLWRRNQHVAISRKCIVVFVHAHLCFYLGHLPLHSIKRHSQWWVVESTDKCTGMVDGWMDGWIVGGNGEAPMYAYILNGWINRHPCIQDEEEDKAKGNQKPASQSVSESAIQLGLPTKGIRAFVRSSRLHHGFVPQNTKAQNPFDTPCLLL